MEMPCGNFRIQQMPREDKPHDRVAEKSLAVEGWLLRLQAVSEHQPNSSQTHLAHGSRAAVWEEYMAESESKPHLRLPTVSRNYFERVWRRHCPHIVTRKQSRFSVCSICDKWRERFTATQDKIVRAALQRDLRTHMDFVRKERLQYKSKSHAAREDPRASLVIIIDGAEQGKYKMPYLHTKVPFVYCDLHHFFVSTLSGRCLCVA